MTYLSSPISNCTAAVGGSVPGDGCDVTWSTYGDQWFRATYTSPSASSVAQTIEVQVVAPVDLGSGLSYSTYGNAGPGAIGDCTMASVADWIETTFVAAGTIPSDQDTIAAYWSAEDVYNGGADVGLNWPDLTAYWANDGIDGTYLTAANPVSGSSAVETNLSSRYVLLTTVWLTPGEFGSSATATDGAHQWLIVGYSTHGPMIVTWGQEFQISWSEFDSMTTGVWSIGVSS